MKQASGWPPIAGSKIRSVDGLLGHVLACVDTKDDGYKLMIRVWTKTRGWVYEVLQESAFIVGLWKPELKYRW